MIDRYKIDPTTVFRGVLILGFLVMLAANMPGHLSLDSVMQLYEGRHHVRLTWAPAVYAVLLGFFDHIVPGTGLYLVASGAIAFGALLALRELRPTMSWLGPLAALLAVLSPGLLIYQGIVWKDVLFANLASAAFVLLAHTAKVWSRPGRPWLALIGLVLIFALAAQVRQNGLIAAGVAAIVMAWTARGGGWPATVGWSVGGLISVVLVSLSMGVLAQPLAAGPDAATHRGVRIVQHYDIIGISAKAPTLDLTAIRAADPAAARVIRTQGAAIYSPERVDYLRLDPAVGLALWSLPDEVVARQWRDLILQHPLPYLAHRWDTFRWVFLTPEIDSCLPLYVGVAGPIERLVDLKIPEIIDPVDQHIYNYGTWFLDTPVFSHLSYALICALTAVLVLVRREPQDVAMAGLMVAALSFVASFFVISIACDYRYLYFVDLAAVTGLIYLVIDPPLAALGFGRPK